MDERQKYPETQKEFWGGHTFTDDCPAKEYQPQSSLKDNIGCLLVVPAVVEAWIHVSGENRERRRIFNELRSWRAIRTGTPIRTLRAGDTFKLSDFPKGTIIRYSYDFQIPDFHSPFSRILWGMKTEVRDKGGNPKDVVYSFPDDALDKDVLIFRGSSIYRDEEIGVVEHSKTKDSPLSVSQALRRINWLEVWKFGQEVRKRQSLP